MPAELIAQRPAERRDASRLLVLDRAADRDPETRRFADLPEILRAGDLLVVNDARVDPVRLYARRPTGGAVEVLLVRPRPDLTGDNEGPMWEAMVRPGKRLRRGERIVVEGPGSSAESSTMAPAGNRSGSPPNTASADRVPDAIPSQATAPERDVPPAANRTHVAARAPLPTHVELVVGDSVAGGRRLMELPEGIDPARLLATWGRMPLPPYIGRTAVDGLEGLDRERYQTVYARAGGAVAAPTAGLHFTDELLDRLAAAGIERATLTLRVGPGTFLPVRVNEVDEHVMEAETYELPQSCIDAIGAARARGGRVVGVGTTVVRALEHAARVGGGLEAAGGEGSADIFIHPGFEFRVIDAMLTNFHLPRSTPILLAAALAGRERLLRAYELAVRERFRFYSYGDAMLIL